jgi:hypothetical protein
LIASSSSGSRWISSIVIRGSLRTNASRSARARSSVVGRSRLKYARSAVSGCVRTSVLLPAWRGPVTITTRIVASAVPNKRATARGNTRAGSSASESAMRTFYIAIVDYQQNRCRLSAQSLLSAWRECERPGR